MKDILLYGAIAGLALVIGILLVFPQKSSQFGVVNMQMLIAARAQHLAKTHQNKATVHQIQELSDHLKEELKEFAATHHVVLLATGAVVGGNLPDFTAEILELSAEGEKQ